MSRQAPIKDELVFLPLGGAGEIGMNLYLYGFGPSTHRKWLMIDLGLTFGGPLEPGIELILPDIRYIKEERENLVGIILTHGHEDHYGAVIDLWPQLRAPIYATPFTTALLKAKMAEIGISEKIPVTEIGLQSKLNLGPFDIELISMAHSIPEPSGIVIRTSLGTVFHTGDWKLDPHPIAGLPADEERLKSLGQEGVGVLICDSTNAMTQGISPSERDVGETIEKIIAQSNNRVLVTTFASNVARIASVCRAARNNDRHLVLSGRAMWRVLAVAQETGYIDNGLKFLDQKDYGYLPRDKVVLLCTGSQGETRAALARIGQGRHPHITLAKDDLVIFSSRTIPGNEKSVSRLKNQLCELGASVITDKDALVHVSGHPRCGELARLYDWVKPDCIVPMHGEIQHMQAHEKFARSKGINNTARALNGRITRLLPGPAEAIDEAPSGRILKDGNILVDEAEPVIKDRRRLSYVGIVTVSIVISKNGEVLSDPRISFMGIPAMSEREEEPMKKIIFDEIYGILDSLPRPKRRDRRLVEEALRRGVRSAVNRVWGKRPNCFVHVLTL